MIGGIRGRSKWLAEIINARGYTRGAEIGAAIGLTTSHVLRQCKKVTEYIVADDWRPVTEVNFGPFIVDNMKEQFIKAVPQSTRLKILEGISWDMADKVQNESLDFIFVDASHDYESCLKDLEAWVPKVRPGGMISGHDVHWPGVIKALEEFYPNYEHAGVDNVWYYFKKLSHAKARY